MPTWVETAELLTQQAREHGNDPLNQVHAGGSSLSLLIQCAALPVHRQTSLCRKAASREALYPNTACNHCFREVIGRLCAKLGLYRHETRSQHLQWAWKLQTYIQPTAICRCNFSLVAHAARGAGKLATQHSAKLI